MHHIVNEEARSLSHSAEEHDMRVAVAAWGRSRFHGCRCVHEVTLGDGRIDLVFVGEKNLVGVEVKSGRDKLDRLDRQIAEYSRYLPEVWVAIAPKWEGKIKNSHRMNIIVVEGGGIRDACPERRRPHRDDLVCTRLLEVLWRDEAARIAQRTDVIPGSIPTNQPRHLILPMLARLLTGNEILREVATELRGRPAFGAASDVPQRAEAAE